MPTNNNTSISKRIRSIFRIQQAVEEVPNQVASSILPVVDVSAEKEIIVFSDDREASGTATLYTTSSEKRTFLTNFYVSYMHNATADSTDTLGTITPKNQPSRSIIRLKKLSLTATQDQLNLSFPFPIELEPNTVISIKQTFTVGGGTISGGCSIYEEEI